MTEPSVHARVIESASERVAPGGEEGIRLGAVAFRQRFGSVLDLMPHCEITHPAGHIVALMADGGRGDLNDEQRSRHAMSPVAKRRV